ncbi:MAG: hypothetical protein ACD_81C00067G0006 [uncultured bacterium]|uniref:Penicillin-binding protein 2 n=2 Tax=Candidatus Wolfeibacteriota TaxID=1752735 RepID=A0A0G1H8S9_9BACT|nr:MAG: hypothetical protein ACD_81C00067G0006 [uncultured bacterium]KKR12079.1 MAG: Penicillin-binding protein 2 [Candidatus Wolfebacteria bacterium GW2011_GWC2_39_22]KKT42903.1 MAG: Penicillin-binding protein 2 [Candidatus Wolfebacteria bacterium GW2011_GWE2_44_13]HBI25316.1 penicillin-binding protein 2 [Candidatus Wolfebacteria bacterium]
MRPRRNTELFLEESVLDDMASSMDCVEMPLSKGVFTLVAVATTVIACIVFGKVFFLGVNAGGFYKDRAIANVSDITVKPAERGVFFDRFGTPLVRNIPTFRAVLSLSNFFKKDIQAQEKEIEELARIITINKDEMRALLSRVNLERQSSIVVARDLTIEQVAAIKNIALDDVNIENDFKRQYEEPGMFSHVTGYVGLVSGDDMEEDASLLLNDLIGKSGLELQYNNDLRGKNGALIDYRNAKNESLGQKTEVAPEHGNNAHLTIDGDLQTYFYRRLKEQLENMGRTAGAGIVMDPDTGEVLAMVSLPTFDNNRITKEDLTNTNRPLFNRVVSGLYNPASTIKPLVATAALQEGVMSTDKSVFSKGYIEIPNPYHPDQPSRFVDWKAHGWVNVYSALARSSNVYFYAAGGGFEDVKGLGIERLRKYWHTFGLDEKTNIDMPGEKVGFLPSIEEKEERTGLPWRVGDTYNISIGQGDLTMTPIELINYISSIATRGIMYQPFVMKKLVDEKGAVIREQQPQVLRDISSLKSSMDEVEKGMIETTQKDYGTAKLLKNLPFVVAGKTGSAQVSMKQKTNAFFTGYGPIGAEKRIAVLVLIEDAREGGSNSVPVAYDVFKWYYENRMK